MNESRRAQMSQSLLKKSLVELLETKDIKQITIKEICENADVSRSTFYAYYGSQYDLLDAIRQEIIDKTKEMRSREPCSDEVHTRVLLEHHLRYVKERIRSLQIYSVNGMEDYSIPQLTMKVILEPYLRHELIDGISSVPEKIYDDICLFAIFGCIALVKDRMKDPTNFSPEKLSNEMINYLNILIKGVLTESSDFFL